jgi:hypothetical protein
VDVAVFLDVVPAWSWQPGEFISDGEADDPMMPDHRRRSKNNSCGIAYAATDETWQSFAFSM